MNITLNTSAFRAVLASAASIAKPKSTLAILGNVLLRADGSVLTVAASDLSTTYTGTVSANVKEPGALALGCGLLEVVASLTAEEVTLRATEGGGEIRAGKSRFQLAGLPPADFPSIHEAPSSMFEVDTKVLARIVDGVGFCCDLAEKNPALQGVFIDFESGTAMSAGRVRCASMTLPLGDGKGKALVPRAALAQLLKIAGGGRVEVAVTPAQIFMRSGTSVVSTKVIEADFPISAAVRDNYFRSKSDHEVSVPRVAFMDALRRVSLVTSKLNNHEVMLSFVAGKASLTCKGSGIAEDEIAVGYDGKGIERAVSAKQVSEALDAMNGDEVSLGFNENKFDPIVIRPVAEEMGEEHVAIVLGIDR